MANFPSNPSNGNTHTIGNTVWVYNSTSDSWLIQDVTEYAVASLDNTPPAQPVDGTLWYEDSVTNRMYIFIDGDWIDAGPSESSNITSSTHLTTSSSGTSYTISHGNTSSISGAKGSTGDLTKIDQITVDANGHVTAVTTGPIGHSNTSNLNGVYGSTSDSTKIDQITVDSNGHITNITTGTVSGGSAGQGNMSVGDLAVGYPTLSTHINGSNYAGSTIRFGGTTGSGTWKCISRAAVAGGVNAQNGAALSNNGLYQRVS
jgi:hypothetical protein